MVGSKFLSAKRHNVERRRQSSSGFYHDVHESVSLVCAAAGYFGWSVFDYYIVH